MRDTAAPIKWKRRPKVLVLGLDGLDFHLTREWLRQGQLPNLSRVATKGHFSALQTVNPAVSPVAWSSFLTGCNPGKHGIFDFVAVDPRTMWPGLTTVRTSGQGDKRQWQCLRQLPTIGQIVESHGLGGTHLFVPVNFPAPSDSGVMLSGMETPDRRGTQGTFTLFTTDPAAPSASDPRTKVLTFVDGVANGELNLLDGDRVRCEFRLRDGRVAVRIGAGTLELDTDTWSDWLLVATERSQAVLQLYCRSVDPSLTVYVSPLQYPPGAPLISSPPAFGASLVDMVGVYPTCGYPYDTDALNADALDDSTFLTHLRDTAKQLHATAIAAAELNDADLFTAFFLEADAVQHMFWRGLDYSHPLYNQAQPFKDAILDTYRNLDLLVGRFLDSIDDQTAVFILSDHGFHSFKMNFDVNRWLSDRGYLVRVPEAPNPMGGMYAGVDWSKTQAYSYGMGRISINLKGRERFGSVEPGVEVERLIQEMVRELKEIPDPRSAGRVVSRAWRSQELYHGEFAERAPDLTLGLQPGYRSASNSAVGGMAETAVSRNNRRWSGDHGSVDPLFVPGVLFTNRTLVKRSPTLLDLAPTILNTLGIQPPNYMDGVILTP